jgi:hypothetical protein
MSFGYGFFIEELDFLNIIAKSSNLSLEELLRKRGLLEEKDEGTIDVMKVWRDKGNTNITFDRILDILPNFSIHRTYSWYYDRNSNQPNSIMFVGKIFSNYSTSIRYSAFFQFLEEKKEDLRLDQVNNDLKRNGFSVDLCDFYILNRTHSGIIYKKEETVKL